LKAYFLLRMTPTQTLTERPRSLSGLLQIINRWKYPVIGLTVLAAIISTVVSLLLPNEYKSTTVFLPTSLRGTNPENIMKGEKFEGETTPADLDRIITIGQSQPLAEHVIQKFELYKDYGLTSMNDEDSKQYVLDQFMTNLDILHNERDAIELSFFSKDPKRAALVANEIVNQIDVMNQQLTLENRQKVVSIFEKRFQAINKVYSSLRDSLQRARKQYGVFGTEKEDRYLGRAVIETQTALIQAQGEYEALKQTSGTSSAQATALYAKIKGLERALASLTKPGAGTYNTDSYFEGADLVYGLSTQLKELTLPYTYARTSLEDVKVGISGNISTIYVVQKAYPPMRKAKPIRWLMVVSSTMLAFALAVIFVALIELYKREMNRLSL
jgi:uncharacterized protein involved in exopolysaccharide biosynthesis